MPRKPQGWRLRPPRPGVSGNYTVIFTWGKREIERSTGTADPERAAIAAAQIYAREVSRPVVAKPAAPTGPGLELEGAVARWLSTLIPTHDPSTVACYADYAESHWLPFFEGLHRVTDEGCDSYMRFRLTRVQATTARKELSALRGFVKWASSPRVALVPPCTVPPVPARATGKTYEKRRRAKAIPMTPAEVRAIIRDLPEWSTSKKVPPFPVKARFEVAYETGLRPELLDLLSVPEHYRRGATHIAIPPELDKAREARRVPLSPAARKALDRVCPEAGLIFGAHDYRPRLRAAATAALPPERAELFCGAHLRSARITHWLDAGAPLTGVMRLVGHTRLETTAGYVRAADKAAEAIVAPKRRRR